MGIKLEENPRPLDYTLVIGNNMENSMESITPGLKTVPRVKYNSEMFYFDPSFSDDDIARIYEWDCESNLLNKSLMEIISDDYKETDSHVIIIPGGTFNYSRQEKKNMDKLNKMVTLGSTRNTIQWYKMEASDDQKFKVHFPYKSFNKTGFCGKTDGGNNIFNLIDFIDHQAYLITIVSTDFISKSLTNSIRDAFRKIMPNYAQNYDYPEILFRGFFKPHLINFSDLLNGNSFLLSHQSIKDVLKNSKEFQKSFSELRDRNIIINFHVLSRNFI